ncbi:hypothetical protein [Microbacterium sp.]|uniref:hypothetical protein n=1 Tax=Microbacterium sp. TaxID=51671 RepID=UPI003A8B2F93
MTTAIVARLQAAGMAVASVDLVPPPAARDGVLDVTCDVSDACDRASAPGRGCQS